MLLTDCICPCLHCCGTRTLLVSRYSQVRVFMLIFGFIFSSSLKKVIVNVCLTVTESSSDGSYSSDSDEQSSQTLMFRAKHMLKPSTFDGQGSFETFWAQFENCVEHNKWTRAQKLVFLKNALDKDAANVLWDYCDGRNGHNN